MLFLSRAGGGYYNTVLDSAGQLLVSWVQLERLQFSFGVLSTFIKIFEGFYFKLIKDYEMEYSILTNKQSYS